MEWTGELKLPIPRLRMSPPTAKKELSQWDKINAYPPAEERERHGQEIANKYIAMFHARIRELLSSVGSKTPSERIQDLLDIRNEFFAYPVEIEKDFLDEFQRKTIDHWDDMSEEALQKNDPFRDYWREASEYSENGVPGFDQKKHLATHFSGFVRNVEIMPEKIGEYSKPIFEADGAYIQNGKIIWSIKNLREGGGRNYIVKWYSGDFILEEEYIDEWSRNPEQEAPKPASQRRKAYYRFIDPLIQEVSVIQSLEKRYYQGREKKNEQFFIRIIKQDYTHKVVTADQSTHPELISSLKTDPTFLSNVANVISLLQESEQQ